MTFKIDKKFLKSSYHLIELKLCSIRLLDNSKFPWVILIPKRNKISKLLGIFLLIVAVKFFYEYIKL